MGLDNWQFKIYTDANIPGWGATLFNSEKSISKTGGRRLGKEKTRHINFLELRAIQFLLFSLFRDISLITLFVFNAIPLLLFPIFINLEAVGIAQ